MEKFMLIVFIAFIILTVIGLIVCLFSLAVNLILDMVHCTNRFSRVDDINKRKGE